MRILKLKGKTEAAILKEIEREYGTRALIMSTQKEEMTGLFKWFKSPKTVITIALKEADDVLESDSKDILLDKQVGDPYKENQASYELLMDLKNQLGQLHEELGELKKSSMPIVKETVMQHDQIAFVHEKNRLASCLQNKLIHLGVKPEISELLLSNIEAEESEAFIRELFTATENVLIEKQEEELPQIIFFIGSTGVGKTTTIAKLTAQYVLEEHKKVVLFTSDTYRIAAVEQLKTYADILGVEIEIIYDESELPKYIEKWRHMDHILIDTAGRSHKNEEQVTELKALMKNVLDKQVFLVLNANTTAKDVKNIVQTYEKAESQFDLIVTKLDETDEIGNVININYYSQKAIRYLTNGQNVPSDIKVFDKQNYITELLGRLNDE